MQALQVNYTGSWLGPVQFAVSEKLGIAGVSVNGSNPAAIPAGLWMENSFAYSETGALSGGLTTLSFPNLVGLTNGALGPTTMAAITSLSFPALTYIGGALSAQSMNALTTLGLPVLSYIGGSVIFGAFNSLTSMSFPALTYVGGTFGPTSCPAVTTLSIPLLAYVYTGFGPSSMAITTLSAPSLAYVGGAITLQSLSSLTTVSLPSLAYVGTTVAMNTSNGNIANVTLGTVGTLKAIVGATINISGQKLTSASVNGILALLVSLDGTNGTTLWGSGKTLTINGGTNAAPSGQGVTDKATLVARGATVTTN